MSVEHGGERVPSFSTDGVGAGQGKRQSPDIFAAGVTVARDRVAAVAEGAGVAHPPWAITAFAESGWSGRSGTDAPRLKWVAAESLRPQAAVRVSEAPELSGRQAAAVAFAGCGNAAEAHALLESLNPGLDPIAQYLDDNALYAATVAGAARVWRALCRGGDESGFVYKCGKGKSEFQFFGFPDGLRAFWTVSPSGARVTRRSEHVEFMITSESGWTMTCLGSHTFV
jgi:hypothetical protein